MDKPRRAMYTYIYGNLRLGKRQDEINAYNILRDFEGRVLRTPQGLMMYDDKAGYWSSEQNDHFRLVLDRSDDIIEGERLVHGSLQRRLQNRPLPGARRQQLHV